MGDKLGDKSNKKLTKNRSLILELISENSTITINELSNKIKISTTAIENNIKFLKNSGFLQRIGSDKGGYWKVINKI